MSIRQLSEAMINQIAAGEVIERPASVVKELVENALDADARKIDILVSDGGRTLIQVCDDGCGMDEADLQLCIERHATSKIQDGCLLQIKTLGFRGEALPSIGSVSELGIASRAHGSSHAWEIVMKHGSVKSALRPAALSSGTRVDVSHLFLKTPARLKFLKSNRSENMAVGDVVRRLAMAYPRVSFTFSTGERHTFDVRAESGQLDDDTALLSRLSAIMGSEFTDNSMAIHAQKEGLLLSGYAGVPTLHRANARMQYLFVNGRFIRDKLLQGAVRAAYADVMHRDRHPLLALFLSIDPSEVDVNVHPAKVEVRFRDGGLVRSLIVGALKQAIDRNGCRTSTTVATSALSSFSSPSHTAPSLSYTDTFSKRKHHADDLNWYRQNNSFADADTSFVSNPQPQGVLVNNDLLNRPLGSACAQLHENYIVTQTRDGMVIVDQHAAHERLVYERMKTQMSNSFIARQCLLTPEIVTLESDSVARLVRCEEEFATLGLVLESFGVDAIVVREVPALLGQFDIASLLKDLSDDLADMDTTTRLQERLDHIMATMACYGSVRSGRVLGIAEMNALLRQMEETALSGQCNHGRPTYVELKLNDIERLFGRC